MAADAVKNGRALAIFDFAENYLGLDHVRKHCHRRISPPQPNENCPVFHILWSSNRNDMSDEHWTSNHFVSLFPMCRSKLVKVAHSETLA
ncbi:hypothetical protein PoB_001677500 [Plakobranchus ocellatus]|uniref:Uncharacterized protein n=1 Tax=Plakobranchus ocellatus TaxID=259542 RepID=A0AAV3Z546_9GAST|nr:hypothetical protein PoB_001677500 [Plakobranchus ocellatus]